MAGAGARVDVGDPDDHEDDENSENGPGGGAQTVTIQGSAFVPASVSGAAGTTVTWVNEDGFAHTTTANDGT